MLCSNILVTALDGLMWTAKVLPLPCVDVLYNKLHDHSYSPLVSLISFPRACYDFYTLILHSKITPASYNISPLESNDQWNGRGPAPLLGGEWRRDHGIGQESLALRLFRQPNRAVPWSQEGL